MYHTKNTSTVTVGQCTATVIADSTWNNQRITTMELVYPRFIHSEFMTHRMFSRNASSSRATPVKTLLEELEEDYAKPSKIFMNKKGMVGDVEATEEVKELTYNYWDWAHMCAIIAAKHMAKAGVHKQHINRLLEPFSFIRVIVTATEWENFFKLRLAPDAQPEIQELAQAMKASQEASTPKHTPKHMPYITWEEEDKYRISEVIKVSAARCARVSYLKHDGTKPNVEDDLRLSDMLLEGGHKTPFEHFALYNEKDTFHANLKGWASARYALEHELVASYNEWF